MRRQKNECVARVKRAIGIKKHTGFTVLLKRCREAAVQIIARSIDTNDDLRNKVGIPILDLSA
jgi:hypothetical protein